jgi:hypothetical protein
MKRLAEPHHVELTTANGNELMFLLHMTGCQLVTLHNFTSTM